MAQAHSSQLIMDPRSGFCKSNSVFYSKRNPVQLPQKEFVDITTYISSRPHNGKTAFIDAASGRRFSFTDVWRAVDAVSSCLADMRIRKGIAGKPDRRALAEGSHHHESLRYFSNPEATANTLDSSGWLRTGDLCYIDDDGFIFIVDRLKELIKYKGYQVPPAELEALLLTHPEIADAAVIPFPDKKVGQFPMAYIQRKAGSHLSETEVMDFIAKLVAPYKRIRRVAFIDSIPKNASGKILRKDLIQLATSKL